MAGSGVGVGVGVGVPVGVAEAVGTGVSVGTRVERTTGVPACGVTTVGSVEKLHASASKTSTQNAGMT